MFIAKITRTSAFVVLMALVGAALGAAYAQAQETGKIPITTASAEARALYLKGRDLAEKLRATDARRFYEQAVEKDKGFALGYVGLAAFRGATAHRCGHTGRRPGGFGQPG